MDRLADFRSVFAQVVLARAGLADQRLLRAFTQVPRHEFIGKGPWYFREDGAVISDDFALLYQDVGMGLAPERGITTGLPSLHARCMAACELRPGERVIHVGAGTGYFTAILAELVGKSGSVTAFEVDTALAEAAARNLERWSQVRVKPSSGVSDLPGNADVIYVSASVQQPPPGWFEALASAGRLLFPLTPTAAEGGILLVQRLTSQTVFEAKFLSRARFVSCVGTEDDAASELLKKAFAAGGDESVRSLRLAPEAPDGTAWFCGRDWWLSTRSATEAKDA